MGNILKLLFSRIGIVAICILVQIVWLLLIVANFRGFIPLNAILTILSILIVLAIIKSERHIDNKLPWIILIILVPFFGGLLYVLVGANLYATPMLKRINGKDKNKRKYLKQDLRIINDIKSRDLDVYGQVNYISDYVGYPIYNNTDISYFPIGEKAYEVMIEELKKAKKFIFLEYFIIGEGQMWQSILTILEQKVKEGLDVRIIYDDVGSIKSLPNKYDKFLESKGIRCIVFNKLKPIIAVIMNNRDHRKIMIIDGNISFSGGINIADEYINKKEKYGHWKDNGIMIKGEATWNFTVMFLKIWNAYREEDKSFEKFRPTLLNEEKDGYILPYGENPLDDEIVGENIYLNIINQSKRYVYIFTPYLIIDNEMISAITLARKRGVDVRIVTPGIPDKKIVFTLTRSYYEMLIKDGVKIYEYTPGFLHSKVFVCDDKIATVGTLNLDYRSLYLHFECGLYIYAANVIKDIKNDVLETINKSHIISIKECKSGFIKSMLQAILKIFAPLM